MTFKILFSAGKSLIPGDKPSGVLENARKKMTCCLPEPLFCSAELNQAGGTECPAVQTMSWVGSGIAARPKITSYNQFQKAGGVTQSNSQEDCVGERGPLHSGGNNSFLRLVYWPPRTPTMKPAE